MNRSDLTILSKRQYFSGDLRKYYPCQFRAEYTGDLVNIRLSEYRLTTQVLYGPAKNKVWTSGTKGRGVPSFDLRLQMNGELVWGFCSYIFLSNRKVLFDSKNAKIWSSQSAQKSEGSYYPRLVYSKECEVSIEKDGKVIWSLGTNGSNAYPNLLQSINFAGQCASWTNSSGSPFIFSYFLSLLSAIAIL